MGSACEKPGRDNNWTFVTFLDATLLFRPEDKGQIWLCKDEDDPACYGPQHLTKVLYVSLQEYPPPLQPALLTGT